MTAYRLVGSSVLLAVGLAACGGGGGGKSSAVPLAPSQAPISSAAKIVVPTSAARGVLVNVHLPLRNAAALDSLIANQTQKSSPLYHHFLTPEQFRASYAPSESDIAAAQAYLAGQGFTTYRTSQGILADGDVPTIERTLNVHLRAAQSVRDIRSATNTFSVDRAVTLPQALKQVGATVSFASHTYHVMSRKAKVQPDNRYGTNGPYWFTDLKQAYGYPSYTAANGSGVTIGIVIGSDVLDSDTAAFFSHEKLAPTPTVARRPVLGGAGFDPVNNLSSVEASLDVQQSLGSAPGAHVVLYDTPDLTDASILAAYTAAVEDNKVDIVSSSFGLCELYYTAAYNGGTDFTYLLSQYHDIFRQGNAQGITFVASSGDNGAYECYDPTGSQKILGGIASPADDTDVTAVGGTNLQTTYVAGSRHSAYVSENANDDPLDPAQGYAPNDVWGSGGGVSQLFAKPFFQNYVNTHSNFRTIPDVSMQMGGCPGGTVADCTVLPRSSVATYVAGTPIALIGTSASAPEFAGLLAVTASGFGTRLGNANTYIYVLAFGGSGQYYHQNIPGNNGYNASRGGYNYVVGVGTPHAAQFALDGFDKLAGDPQTPSNP